MIQTLFKMFQESMATPDLELQERILSTETDWQRVSETLRVLQFFNYQ